MLPTSNPAPIDLPLRGVTTSPAVLRAAFAEFSAAALRLESSYLELQKEVTQLRAALAERSQALRSSRAETAEAKVALRQIVDALPCGVLVLNGERRVTLMNPEAMRLLGIMTKTVETLADTPLNGHASVEAALDSGVPDETEDELRVATSPTPRWVAVRRKLLRAGGNDVQAGGSLDAQQRQTILILRDTTRQRKLESDREQARNTVALAEMSALLAHEIRNPLASMELFAGLIDGENTESARYVTQLRAGIRRLSATINNVMQLHGGGRLQLMPLPLGEILSRAVEFIRPLAEQKQIALSLTDHANNLVVASDENALQQLVANLAVNAFRHTPSGGSFAIVASPVRGECGLRAQIGFRDSGCGIPPDWLPRLFEPGFSGSSQALGLGLAVCRQIAEQHGGCIRVSSRLGEGSTFTVELPAQ